MSALLVAVPTLPLAAAALLAVARPRWRVAGLASTAAVALSTLALLPIRGVAAQAPWLDVGPWQAAVGLRADGLAWTVALLVACVSLAVNVYALGYMSHGHDRRRFFAWMSFFEGAMLALVLASSLLLLFAAWEAVGLASWALIAHEDRDPEARRAGAQAFLVTRLGDMALLLALAGVLFATGTADLDGIAAAAGDGRLSGAVALALAGLIVVAALAKSAQLPLTAWLPDAMVGPAPVSALIHSATMVAAGVFLLLRLWPVMEAAPGALAALRWIGATTALAAALAATAADDLKRLLAWSTVEELGLMMLALGLGAPLAAALHLVFHALFKAALFLGAGVVDEAAGTRSLRRLGGLGPALPWTAAAFTVAAATLAGVPPLAGFVSGDLVLAGAGRRGAGWAAVVVSLVFLAATAIARAAAATFLSRPGARPREVERPRAVVTTPLLLLASAAAVAGLALRALLQRTLPFVEGAEAGSAWRVAALCATAAGLGLGVARVRRRGAAPALGLAFRLVPAAVSALVAGPAAATVAAGRAVSRLERALDAAARALATGVGGAARGVSCVEEGVLDPAARGAAAAVRASARAVDVLEVRGIAPGVDGAARGLGRLGALARLAQSGRLYAYTAAIAAVVLVAVAAGLAIGALVAAGLPAAPAGR